MGQKWAEFEGVVQAGSCREFTTPDFTKFFYSFTTFSRQKITDALKAKTSAVTYYYILFT